MGGVGEEEEEEGEGDELLAHLVHDRAVSNYSMEAVQRRLREKEEERRIRSEATALLRTTMTEALRRVLAAQKRPNSWETGRNALGGFRKTKRMRRVDAHGNIHHRGSTPPLTAERATAHFPFTRFGPTMHDTSYDSRHMAIIAHMHTNATRMRETDARL